MTALLAGASGLVGHAVASAWTGPGNIHLLMRKPPAATLGPQQQVLLVDYATLPTLPPADEAYCCLGTTIRVAGSQEAFRAVDYDAVLAFARAARAAGATRFGLVSALGASAQSPGFYSRVKGQAENALRALDFASLVIARPSLLAGDRAALGQPVRTGERIALGLTGPLLSVIPKSWRPVQAAVVARALLRAVRQGQPGVRLLSSAQLQDLGAAS